MNMMNSLRPTPTNVNAEARAAATNREGGQPEPIEMK